MPFKVSEAQGHNDLLQFIRRFVTGQGGFGHSSYTGTGNGTIGDVDTAGDAGGETWTITVTSVAGGAGNETWSVVGSVSGAQANATTGVLYDIGLVTFLITAGGTNFVVSDAFTVKPTNFTGTGNGTIGSIEMKPAAVDENWTITCTSIAGGAGSETWSVVGSVSGTLAAATTGVAYTSALLDFLITAGGTNFAVNDAFTFSASQSEMSAISRAWVEDKWTGTELYLKGVGLDGTKEIFVGLRSFFDVGLDIYNLAIMGATGHIDSNAFDAQPGTSGEKYVPMWNQAIPFRLYCNGQRIMLHAKIETVYVSLYMGFIIPYSTPAQFPYPLLIGGTTTTEFERYSSTGDNVFFKNAVPLLRLVDGTWLAADVWPDVYNTSSAGTDYNDTMSKRNVRDTGSGGYVPLPVIIMEGAINTYGEFDGVIFITGFNNAVENTFTDNVSSKEYFISRDFHRTGFWDYAAMEDA